MIGADIAAALPSLRAQAESLMVSTCTIERQAGTEWSEAEQKSVPAWTTIHADLPCTLDVPPTSARALLTDEAVTAENPVVKVPVSATGIKPDDRVTITDRGTAWVTHVPDRDHQVQRRLECRWVR